MNKFLTIAILLMLVVTSVALFATKESGSQLPPDSSTGTAQIGGGFTLTDANGNKLSDTDLRGKNMLVFFGFTRCPMICPTTMATVSSALDQLGEKADKIVPVFITVDAEYDTPAQIKDFLKNFNPKIVGLTGTKEEIDAVAQKYKAFYSEQGGMMDHSTLLYWMDDNGQYISHFPYDIEPARLAGELSKGLK